MIIVTGASGFIGSCIVKGLNDAGRKDIVVVDKAESFKKTPYLKAYSYKEFVDSSSFLKRLADGSFKDVEAIIHMGASTSTVDTDKAGLMKNNLEYSKSIFAWCAKNKCRLIYASSAATYGDGSEGYSDDVGHISKLKPLNYYAESKHLFDQYALSVPASKRPLQCVGLKFFNVYGPNEYHKGQMASMVFHAFNQIQNTGKVRLFKSYKEGFADGEQKRDFVYVRDVVSVVLFFLKHPDQNGIFNVGTGRARSFNDLVKAVFAALGRKVNIEYIEMQDSLKERYQYFTEADITSLSSASYHKPFFSLEKGVHEYVLTHLNNNFASL